MVNLEFVFWKIGSGKRNPEDIFKLVFSENDQCRKSFVGGAGRNSQHKK